MLGSDPLSAVLGIGLDPHSPKSQWKVYLRQLVSGGCALAMLGPDIRVPDAADDHTLRALAAVSQCYPPSAPMPVDTSGKLAGASTVETDPGRVNLRVDSYYRSLAAVAKGTMKQADGEKLVRRLIEEDRCMTPTVALHVALSNLVVVEVPDAAAMAQWHAWSAQASGDRYEQYTAPTLLDPSCRGGGLYLFRDEAGSDVAGAGFTVGGCVITSGDVVVPVPPSVRGGVPVARLGPCRRLPDWLRTQLRWYGNPKAA
ncbi:hypothetical protein H7J07_04735 [Mycobacterium koreense]|uniref:Uncharacterized protein n=1 Tax=Mycolicibacillus koreensis TaxID=1069220 RepID=A0A7I7SAM0_9MYCO|nr:hypothetical protein [Mycolicibacillus koreensis]MCV7247563.1 hypothetical protein [Mycolicibacillus koreensis]OSC32855.1 hypothetical protein B8W67_14145 [Mycolicibacillus koreensis]BBY53942.1 hypothetical protein MKOR_11930 [Mycolicibacillus koreensis]